MALLLVALFVLIMIAGFALALMNVAEQNPDDDAEQEEYLRKWREHQDEKKQKTP